jgi:hypothetical protein
MIDTETVAFNWPAPGEDWFLTQGASLGLDEPVIRFAAALHSLGGADSKKNTQAARLAGIDCDRTAAFRMARSVAVRRLLDAAQEISVGKRPPVTEQEVDEAIDRLIRAPDALTVARGIELREKRRGGRTGAFGDQNKMLLPDAILFGILFYCGKREYRPELWPLVWAEMVLPNGSWHSPLLDQMAPYLKQHHAEFWEGARMKLAQYNLDDLKAKENGPVLSAQDILDLSLKNLVSLVTYLDITTMPEPREIARQDLIQAGLVDRRCA